MERNKPYAVRSSDGTEYVATQMPGSLTVMEIDERRFRYIYDVDTHEWFRRDIRDGEVRWKKVKSMTSTSTYDPDEPIISEAEEEADDHS